MDVTSLASSLMAAQTGEAQLATAAKMLRMNADNAASVVKLIDAAGRVREDATVDARGDTIEISLPNNLPHGTQLVSYRVISADGHPVGGSTVFSIGMPTGQAAAPTDDAPGRAVLIWLTRIGVYLGLFAGVGGAFFGTWIAPAM